MMNHENDEIDKMFLDYFNNINQIPDSTQATIDNTLKELQVSPVRSFYKIKKIAIVIISLIAISSSVVLAKELISFISSLFTNTTKGIEKAVENGFVQNVDMDFVYDNDIGIKVDYLLMDDSNLDVSFVYDCKDENVSSIEIYEYIIRDENNNVICFYSDNYINTPYDKTNLSTNINYHKDNFKESILCTSSNMPKSKTLIFEINSIYSTKNDDKFLINGNWIFDINLEDKIINHHNEEYISSYCEYINNISAIISETTLKINIDLTETPNVFCFVEPSNIYLKNNKNESFEKIYSNFKENTIYLEFDLSKYNNNIDILNLYINFDENKFIDIILKK